MKYVQSEVARRVCVDAALRRGMTAEHAAWFAEALVQTSLMGIDTHGLRLLPLYLRELDEGRSNPRPHFKLVRGEGGTAVLDADDALGTVAGTHAAQFVAGLAKQHGVGVVAVRNSNHFGAASVYGKLIAAQGLVGLVSTSAAARMAPFNGKVPMFGTNPICFSAPTGGGEAYVFDMATSQISYSQIKHYRKHNQPLPPGWVLDADGETTTDPAAVSALSPLGGYKGQGLAMLVQILSCLLPGMPLDHELEHLDTGRFDQGRRIGHFLLALDPARFGDAARFEQMVAQLLRVVRATPTREGAEVLVPGDPQAHCAALRAQSGIPMSDEEAAALEREAQAVRADHAAAPTSVVEDAAA